MMLLERIALLVASMAVCLTGTATAEVLLKQGTFGRTFIRYKVVLPVDYNPRREYPAVLAFAGGMQDLPTMEDTLKHNWVPEAEKRGYLVFMPEAPNWGLYFGTADRIFPEFFERLLADYRIEFRRFHMAGRSNGGLSAFHIASKFPQYCLSVTGFPGFLAQPPDDYLPLKFLPVFMFVGENDKDWVPTMREDYEKLKGWGFQVTFHVEPGQSHAIGTLMDAGAKRLFDGFDEASSLSR